MYLKKPHTFLSNIAHRPDLCSTNPPVCLWQVVLVAEHLHAEYCIDGLKLFC